MCDFIVVFSFFHRCVRLCQLATASTGLTYMSAQCLTPAYSSGPSWLIAEWLPLWLWIKELQCWSLFPERYLLAQEAGKILTKKGKGLVWHFVTQLTLSAIEPCGALFAFASPCHSHRPSCVSPPLSLSAALWLSAPSGPCRISASLIRCWWRNRPHSAICCK